MTPLTTEMLSAQLNSIFSETINWFEAQPEANFNKELMEGKWTMAGHLYHLIKSTKAVSKGLLMPKLALRISFGKCNRTERSFEEQHQKYLKALDEFTKVSGSPAIPPSKFVPPEGRVFEKEALLNRFKLGGYDYCQALAKWNEKKLSVYVLPHPIMGKLTVREFTYFTIFHTKHHLDILQGNYVDE